MAYKIRWNRPLADELRRVVEDQIAEATHAVTVQPKGAAAAAHSARKNCKKIRALLRLIRGPLDCAFAVENDWYRDAGRLLAEIRDAKSLVEAFEKLLKSNARDRVRDIDTQAAAAIGERLVLRQPTVSRSGDEIQDRFQQFAGQLDVGRQRWRAWWPSLAERDEKITKFDDLKYGFQRTYGDCRDALKVARELPTLENLHEWRKRVKDHMYHVQLLSRLWPGMLEARQRELSTLADYLGDEHDWGLLTQTITAEGRDWCDWEARAAILEMAEARRRQHRSKAFRLGSMLLVDKAPTAAAQFRRFWKAKQFSDNDLGQRPKPV